MTRNFSTLYKKSSLGKLLQWDIGVDGATIITHHGEVGGQIQETRDTIREGKNVGRANVTTPKEQAVAEAQSKWKRQIERKGYVESRDRAAKGETDAEGGIVPMLAHKYSEQGHKIVYPAFAQPKLDGARCIATITDGECTLWTRTRKPIHSVPHIVRALEAAFPSGDHVLDGELYTHTHKDNFEEIMSLVRSSSPKKGHEVVEYHVYDYPSDERSFYDRLGNLDTIGKIGVQHVVVVDTLRVANESELMDAFERFLAAGYEGAMVRNAASLYENKRSYGLQKVKEFDDAEFKVIGIEEGRGKLTGHVGAFVCVTDKGVEFRAKAMGEIAALKRAFEDPTIWRGKRLTVKYQGMTNKSGVPRFPVGVRFAE